MVKGVDLTGSLGDIKEDWESGSPPAGSRGTGPVGGLGDFCPPEAEAFLVKLHIIFKLK